MGAPRFRNFYELEQAYFTARRRIRELEDDVLIHARCAEVYRELVFHLTHPTAARASDQLRDAMAFLEGAIAADVYPGKEASAGEGEGVKPA